VKFFTSFFFFFFKKRKKLLGSVCAFMYIDYLLRFCIPFRYILIILFSVNAIYFDRCYDVHCNFFSYYCCQCMARLCSVWHSCNALSWGSVLGNKDVNLGVFV
jgi:hypothetical protein